MVDLDGVGCIGAADEVDRHAAVRVNEGATLGVAGAAAYDEVLQIAAQDVIAGVAAVAAELDVDVVTPGFSKLIPLEVRGAIPAAYLKLFKSLARDGSPDGGGANGTEVDVGSARQVGDGPEDCRVERSCQNSRPATAAITRIARTTARIRRRDFAGLPAATVRF